jgi:hypothetical protein
MVALYFTNWLTPSILQTEDGRQWTEEAAMLLFTIY